MELPGGRVVIELAPAFAPHTIANIETLVRERYFDGLAILRAQDNYVVQWGDPDEKKPLGPAAARIPAEFSVPTPAGQAFTVLPDGDGYAPQVGFSGGFAAARDGKAHRTWLTHCYGAVGVGRDNDPDSGSGAELYVAIAPIRLLDRNVTLVGHVVQGMPLLSTLPRGPGRMGFYEDPQQRVPIRSVRFATELPPGDPVALEVLRTESRAFADYVEARRNRHDPWTQVPAGHAELCSITVPVRPVGETRQLKPPDAAH
jgi:peptidylprolyl isomerase